MKNLIQILRKWLRVWLDGRVQTLHAGPSQDFSGGGRGSAKSHSLSSVHRNYLTAINREDEGAFYYLRDILDRLPRCQKMLKRVKRIDPDAYEYHRRVGARLVPDKFKVSGDQLSDLFLLQRPAIGMTYILSKPMLASAKKKNHVPASFHYFQKIVIRGKDESGLLPTRNDLYKMVVVHDDGTLISGGLAYFEIMPNGIPRIMRKKETNFQSIPTHKRGEKAVTVSHNKMNYPDYIQNMHHDNAADEEFGDYASLIFTLCVNDFCNITSEDELQVRCSKGKVVAMFNVCTKRTPYFFADRETTLAVDGKRKRIFHIVRAHTRDLGNSRISEVKEHYRGERRFWWGGHRVTITVPKLHHLSINSFDVAAQEFDDDKLRTGKNWVTSAQLGEKIAGMME